MRVAALLLALMVAPHAAAPADAGEKPQETRAQDDPVGTEEQESPEDTAQPVFEEEVVVVGSRARPRSVTASPVPVDAIPAREIVSQGDTDLGNQLRAVMPSFNINTQPISDAGIVVRPANLRNLAPDHTLVLVNGKRRHRAAVIHWGGNGVADGAQGPDIAVIPSIALRQVEVLRDGASAQYGSDAIAGVLNFLLKDARSGGSIEVRGGLFGAGDRGGTYGGVDGGSYGFAGNVGLPLGRTGFANLSLEYGNAAPTDRSIQRSDAAALAAAGNTAVRDPVQVWATRWCAARGRRPEAAGQFRSPVCERPAALQPPELCEQDRDRRFLLPESEHALVGTIVPSCAFISPCRPRSAPTADGRC